MSNNMMMERINNPDGHQVCQVDQEHRTVAIRNKNYLTMVCFNESGGCVVEHQRLEKPARVETRVN